MEEIKETLNRDAMFMDQDTRQDEDVTSSWWLCRPNTLQALSVDMSVHSCASAIGPPVSATWASSPARVPLAPGICVLATGPAWHTSCRADCLTGFGHQGSVGDCHPGGSSRPWSWGELVHGGPALALPVLHSPQLGAKNTVPTAQMEKLGQPWGTQ